MLAQTEVQRYEGASTLYGPWTLAAYQQLYTSLADAMLSGTPVPPGPTPPNLYDRTVRSLHSPPRRCRRLAGRRID